MNPPSAAPHASIHSSGRDRKPAASLAVLKGRHTASLLSAHRHVRQALSRRTSRLWLLVCHQPRTSPCRHGHRSQSGRVYGQETINLLQVSVVVGCIVGLEAKKRAMQWSSIVPLGVTASVMKTAKLVSSTAQLQSTPPRPICYNSLSSKPLGCG